MDGTILSVIGVGVTLAAISWFGDRAICREISGLSSEIRSEISGLSSEIRSEISGPSSATRNEISGLRSELHALGERVARIEGQLARPPCFVEPPPRTDGEQAA